MVTVMSARSMWIGVTMGVVLTAVLHSHIVIVVITDPVISNRATIHNSIVLMVMMVVVMVMMFELC